MDDLPCRSARIRLWVAGLLIMAAAGGCADPEVITGTDPEASAATGWDWSSTYTVPAVTCLPASVAHLQTVNCNITEPEFATFEVLAWRFDAANGDDAIVVDRPTSTSQSWSGPVVVSGKVTVQVRVNGVFDQLTDSIKVTRRTWSWATSVGGQQGNPGEIDQCVPTDSVAGFTSGKSCNSVQRNELFTPLEGGYDIQSVFGDGPNGAIRYIANPTITMDLRTQINKRFRSDADTLDVPMTGDTAVVNACQPQGQRKTHFFVNTDCAPRPAYSPYLTSVWNHEARHVDSAVVAAKKPTGDVHALWEPLVSNSSTSLGSAARMVRTDARKAIRDFAVCSHTGFNQFYHLWMNMGDSLVGWVDTQVSGGEDRESHCPPL